MRPLRLATLAVLSIAAVVSVVDGVALAQSVDPESLFSPPATPRPRFVPAPDSILNSLRGSKPQTTTGEFDFPESLPESSSPGLLVGPQPPSPDQPTKRVSITLLPPVLDPDPIETSRKGNPDLEDSSDFRTTRAGLGASQPCPLQQSLYRPATSSCLHAYEQRIAECPHQEDPSAHGKTPEGLPADFQPWWNAKIGVSVARFRGASDRGR